MQRFLWWKNVVKKRIAVVRSITLFCHKALEMIVWLNPNQRGSVFQTREVPVSGPRFNRPVELE
jgi:hypothetical protein